MLLMSNTTEKSILIFLSNWLFLKNFRSQVKLDFSFRTDITKTYLYNFDPLKPHFYIVKLGFTGVVIIFLISAQNIDCGYSLELPLQGGSNEYPQSMFWAEIWKISEFLSENFHFLVVKFSVYLNRHVFIMSLIGCENNLSRTGTEHWRMVYWYIYILNWIFVSWRSKIRKKKSFNLKFCK